MVAVAIWGLYAIVDLDYLRGRDPLAVVRRMVAGAARIFQVRAKDVPSGEYLRVVEQVVAMVHPVGGMVLVNDRPDLAAIAGADGVHLGQDDLPIDAAWKILGPGKVVGLSTHTVHEAADAETLGADYVAFGPIYATTTKESLHAPRGLTMLREVRARVRVPIVAIGGITVENARDVIGAGADAVAVISAILGAENAEAATRAFIAACRQAGR